MEGLLVLGVGALVGLAVAALLGGDVTARPRRVVVRAWARRIARLLRRVARTSPMARLLSWAPLARLARELSRASGVTALPLGVEEAAAAAVVLALASAAAFGLLMGSALASVVALAALVALGASRDGARRTRLRRKVISEMPGVYRTLSVSMGAGQTLAQAVDYVGSHERGPAGGVFARMSLRLRCGVGTEEAVRALAEELDAPGAELLATALVVSHRTGSPLRELLLRSARLAERQGEFERLLAVKTAQVRLSVRIVCLLPVVMVGLLALISPDFQRGLLTPSGVGCVLVALLLDGAALALIRRFMRGVL